MKTRAIKFGQLVDDADPKLCLMHRTFHGGIRKLAFNDAKDEEPPVPGRGRKRYSKDAGAAEMVYQTISKFREGRKMVLRINHVPPYVAGRHLVKYWELLRHDGANLLVEFDPELPDYGIALERLLSCIVGNRATNWLKGTVRECSADDHPFRPKRGNRPIRAK
jgi:hypothetical protein